MILKWAKILRAAFIAAFMTLGLYPVSRSLAQSAVVLLAIWLLYLGGQSMLAQDEIAVRKTFLVAAATVFVIVFVFHIGREYALYGSFEPLSMFYDRGKCRTNVGEGTCAAIRILVRNNGKKTITGVGVTIDEIVRLGGAMADDEASQQTGPFSRIGMSEGLRQFEGLPLAVSPARYDEMPLRFERPKVSVPLHSGRESYFDLMRICKQPANHSIQHASYRPNPLHSKGHPHPIEQYPQGTIPPGDYMITLSATGDNVAMVTKTFRVIAGEIEA